MTVPRVTAYGDPAHLPDYTPILTNPIRLVRYYRFTRTITVGTLKRDTGFPCGQVTVAFGDNTSCTAPQSGHLNFTMSSTPGRNRTSNSPSVRHQARRGNQGIELDGEIGSRTGQGHRQ